MSKRAIVLLAEGFEEVEAVTPIDYLRRAGVELATAAIGKNKLVNGSHGIQICADTTLGALLEDGKLSAFTWDCVVVPGGLPGSDNLAVSAETQKFLKEMDCAGKLICAICAAPARVLAPLGLLKGKKFTCYPGEEKKVADGEWKQDRVAADGNIITSRGAGTAGEFSCAIIDALLGGGEGKKIAKKVLLAGYGI